MSTPIKDLQTALWAHLANQTAYTALGLREYRFYDGNLLPFDWKTGRIGDVMPCISALVTDAGRENIEGDRSHAGTSSRWFVTLDLTLIYRASEGDATLAADLVDAAMNVIRDALDPRPKRQALDALLNGSFEWSPKGGLAAGKNGPEAGAPRLWAWTWEITLNGVFRYS